MNEGAEILQLNLFQRYRRTVKLDRATSRMKNKDWYRDALSLEIQLHCYFSSETGADCFLYIKSLEYYEAVGSLDLNQLDNDQALQQWLQEMLKLNAVKTAKAKSLGIVFYLTDEFSMAGLGPEYKDPDELPALQALMEHDAKEVLEDQSVSQESHSWRLFPYAGAKPGAEFATAIAVPRRWDELLQSLRGIGDDTNFPIRTRALSAPLCAIASLPWCASPNPKGTVAIFSYAKFTLLTCFNSQSDLLMFRHIPHAQGARVPRNIGPSVFSTATAYELENPEIYVFPMAGEDMDGVIVSLQTAVKGSEVMLVDRQDILSSRGVTVDIPLEMMTATHELDPQIYPLASNATFSEFREVGWPFQDFLSPSLADLSRFPSAKAMDILRLSRWVRMLAIILFIGLLVQSGLTIWKQVMSDEWQYKPKNNQVENAELSGRLKQYKRWDNLLQDRSKAWVNMELISRLIPENGSIQLNDVEHDISLGEFDRVKKKAGLVKRWVIKGAADDQGIQYLDDFNTRDSKKLHQLFRQVAVATGNETYLSSLKGRDITVQFSRQNKPSKRRVGSGDPYAYTFILTIRQSFAPDDPIAITAGH